MRAPYTVPLHYTKRSEDAGRWICPLNGWLNLTNL
ncbi:hypothetical protein CP8484711_1324A, partial [Chlamydia psittaci 84-8471/1]